MRIKEFIGKKVYVWGVPGIEGDAVMKFLAEKLPNEKIRIIENDFIPDDAEIVIKVPGVGIYKEEYKNAIARGVKFTSLMNIFFAELNMQGNRPTVIAVTGTKGKTTTASMLAFMLNKLGHKTGLGGNIGTPPLEMLGQDFEYIVLELSSFQTASLEYYPDYAQVVSISPAHLDWHINYDNYKRDKLRFLEYCRRVYLCGYDEYLKTLTLPNAQFYYKTELPLPPLKVFGEHNIINMSGALALIKDLGLDEKAALATLSDFEPIEHRLEKVFESNGIIFINDSIATVAESTIAGLKAFSGRPIAVIVGGYDNTTANYGTLSKFITENDDVKIAVGLPDTGKYIESPKLKMVGPNMHDAVKEAISALPHGGVVLLSPAAPSFNMYKNYKERGIDFANCAKAVMGN